MNAHPQQQDVYPEDRRSEVTPFLPRQVKSALDVGCAKGGFGRTLREHVGRSGRVVGVEPVESQALVADRSGVFDAVYTGFFPEAVPGGERFDLIVFNDVLEHIIDPWETLRNSKSLLTAGGRIVATIPNIQYLPAVINLLRGRWEYTDTGILDRTHVRFFTQRSMIKLFDDAGYQVETCLGVNNFFDRWTKVSKPLRGPAVTASYVFGNARFLHFVVVATPIATPRA